MACQTLIESWNGTTWSVVPSPDVSTSEDNRLAACRAPARRTAPRWDRLHHGRNPDPRRVVERDGLVDRAQPQPGDTPSSVFGSFLECGVVHQLDGVHGGGGQQPELPGVADLTESWDGTAWSVVPSPSPGGDPEPASSLDGVSCIDPSGCTAVGG